MKEETGVDAEIIKYVGKSQYSFTVPEDVVEKDVHWYLMMSDSYYSKHSVRNTLQIPDTTSFMRRIIC